MVRRALPLNTVFKKVGMKDWVNILVFQHKKVENHCYISITVTFLMPYGLTHLFQGNLVQEFDV